jgi:hypothetical protein
MRKDNLDPQVVARGKEFLRLANIGAKAAQEESRRLGVPNVYEINGKIYYELPNGELSLEDPYVEPAKAIPLPADAVNPAAAPGSTAPQR